jgi:hypothetical protein
MGLTLASWTGCGKSTSDANKEGAQNAGQNAAFTLPAASTETINYEKDIKPILSEHCYGCHGPVYHKNGLRLDVKADALKGGYSGQDLIPGNSADSRLIKMVSGAPGYQRMPMKHAPLTNEQIGLLRAWIDQGISWPDDAPAPASAPAPATDPKPEAAVEPSQASVPGLPADWKVEATGQKGPLAAWEKPAARKGPTGEPVVAMTQSNHSDPATMNLLWSAKTQFQNGAIETKIAPFSEGKPSSGGLIWRAKDKNDYYAAVLDGPGKRLRLLCVKDGITTSLAEAALEAAPPDWSTLRVEQAGNQVKLLLNGAKVLDVTDSTFEKPGGVGYCTEGNATTVFTGVRVEPS